MLTAELKRIANLHGHLCFGLVLGYRAAMIAKTEFRIGRAGTDQELIAVIEENSCCEDAIQIVTNCSWHRGTIVFQECGQDVFIFYNHTTGKSIRLELRDDFKPLQQEIHRLKKRILNRVADKVEQDRFWETNEKYVQTILQVPDEELFDIHRYDMTILVRLDRFNSLYVPALNTCPCKP